VVYRGSVLITKGAAPVIDTAPFEIISGFQQIITAQIKEL
jgi:hypothetical protein